MKVSVTQVVTSMSSNGAGRTTGGLRPLCLSGLLSNQSVIRKRFSPERAPQHEPEELLLLPAAIEAIDELIQVALEALPADSVEGATDPGLEIGEDRVAPGHDLGRSSGILPLCVGIVGHTRSLERKVALPAIGSNRGVVSIDDSADKGNQICRGTRVLWKTVPAVSETW